MMQNGRITPPAFKLPRCSPRAGALLVGRPQPPSQPPLTTAPTPCPLTAGHLPPVMPSCSDQRPRGPWPPVLAPGCPLPHPVARAGHGLGHGHPRSTPFRPVPARPFGPLTMGPHAPY
nr:basic proline-rich protein-like [Aegilops tauschii subsp. strangulata]